MITNFCDVAVGSRFEFRGKRYEKMNAQFGRDEDRAGNLFHPRTEIVPLQVADCGVRSKRGHLSPALSPRGGEGVRLIEPKRAADWWLPKPEDRRELEKHDEAVMAAAELAYWRRPARKAGRLGREPDRELRAYGTL